MSDWGLVYFILLMYFKHNGMSSTKMINKLRIRFMGLEAVLT
jgi:hypothetical protein